MIVVAFVIVWAVVEAAMAIAKAARQGPRRRGLFLRRIDWQN